MATNEQPQGTEQSSVEAEYEGNHNLAKEALGELYVQDGLDKIAAELTWPTVLSELGTLPNDETRPEAIAQWYKKNGVVVE